MKAYTTKSLIEKLLLIHGDKYDYSKTTYTGYSNKISVICLKHGEFKISIDSHVNKKSGCALCGRISTKEKSSLTAQEFIERSLVIHENKYEYSNVKYSGLHKNVDIICKEHGVFSQTPHTHLMKY